MDQLTNTVEKARDDATALQALLNGESGTRDEALLREMRWVYPDGMTTGQPLKLTVSGLVRELEGPEQLPRIQRRPQFMEEASAPGMTAAERGTAFHRAMQLLDWREFTGLSKEGILSSIELQLKDFAARGLMTAAPADVVRASRLPAFWSGDTGRRLMASDRVEREWSFNVILRAGEVLSEDEAGRYGDAPLMVQGTIDCCFIEDRQWVLLDYKTDRGDDLDEIARHYEKQLKAYALALEKITEIKVREQLLCLIGQEKTLRVNSDI